MNNKEDSVKEEKTQDRFGCDSCWPVDPDLAWDARGRLNWRLDLIHESHFHVRILTCDACTQHFISVFTERIDWVDGEDPQYWTLLPLTEAEAANFIQKYGSLSEAEIDEVEIETEINVLGIERRSLRRDYPKSAKAPYVFWGYGIRIGPHD